MGFKPYLVTFLQRMFRLALFILTLYPFLILSPASAACKISPQHSDKSLDLIAKSLGIKDTESFKSKLFQALPDRIYCHDIGFLMAQIPPTDFLKEQIPANQTCLSLKIQAKTLRGLEEVLYIQHRDSSSYVIFNKSDAAPGISSETSNKAKAIQLFPLHQMGDIYTYLIPSSDSPDNPNMGLFKELSKIENSEFYLSKDILCEDSNWKGGKIKSILSPHFPLGNISDILEKNQLNIKTKINIAEETLSLLKKLRFIHQNGYAHCNITKENIYLDEKGHLHLGGFDKIIKLQKGKTKSSHKCDSGVIGYRAPEIAFDNFTSQFFDSVRSENMGFIVPLFANMLRHSLGMPDRYINEYSDREAQKSDIFSLGMLLTSIISGEQATKMLEQMKTFEKQIQKAQDLLVEETSQRISDRINHKEKYLYFQADSQVGKDEQDALSLSAKYLDHLEISYSDESKYIKDKVTDMSYSSLDGDMLLFFLFMMNPDIDQRPDAQEAIQSLEALLQ